MQVKRPRIFLSSGTLSVHGFALVLTLAAGCNAVQNAGSRTKVIGGRIADEDKFMAGLVFDGGDTPGCGGTFISDHFVLTAAHCVADGTSALTIIPGGNHSAIKQKLKVLAAVPNAAYDGVAMQNDIAFLVTEAPAPGTVEPISYNSDAAWPTLATTVTVIGRGNETSLGDLFDGQLRQVDLPIVPEAECQKMKVEGALVGPGQICAGDFAHGGIDSCQGDSGGPLVTLGSGKPALVGIVSWGNGCAQAGNPGIYTRVSTQAAWVAQQIQRFTAAPPAVTPSTVRDLLSAYCYADAVTAYHERFVAGKDSGDLIHSLKVKGDFVSSAATVIAKPDCTATLPDGSHLAASVTGEGDHAEIRVQISAVNGATTAWLSNASTSAKELTLACTDTAAFSTTLLLDLNIGIIDDLSSTAPRRPSLLQKASAPLPEASFSRRCQLGGYSVALANSADGTLKQAWFQGVAFPTAGLYMDVATPAPTSEPGDTQITAVIQWEGNKASSHHGTLTLHNASDQDLFTWQLSCPFAFNLADTAGHSYVGKVDGTGYHSVELDYPGDPDALIGKGAGIVMALGTDADLPSSSSCTLNGISVALATAAI